MRKFLIVGFTLAAAAQVAGGQSARAASGQEAASDSLYRAGRAALDAHALRRAAGILKQLADQYPSSDRAGDALYWQAWALLHLGADNANRADLNNALSALTRYNENYGKSGQLASDATDLYSQIRAAQAKLGDASAAGEITERADRLRQQSSCSSSDIDQQTRIAALEGMLGMSSEDAIPILQAVLKQRDPCRAELRKRAVFMIAQKRGPSVIPTLLDVARNDPSADVRGDAIFWLGSSQAEQAIPALDSIIFQSKDEEVRKKAVFAVSQQRGDLARRTLERVALDEKMPEEVRGDAVFWLGQNRIADLDFFKTLFRSTRDADLRSRILNGVATGNTPGAGAWLLDVARDKSFDVETRKSAIFWASQRREMDLNALAGLYDQSRGDDEMQDHILFIYSQRHEAAAVDKLMAIARSDPNIEMRKKALFWLGQKNDPRVKAFIQELINR